MAGAVTPAYVTVKYWPAAQLAISMKMVEPVTANGGDPDKVAVPLSKWILWEKKKK